MDCFPASGSFPMSQFFMSGGQSIGASASVLPMNIQDLKDGLVGSPCSPRDSQESSPAPQFKSINSSMFSFLYGAALTSIHDYWRNHSFDQKMDLGTKIWAPGYVLPATCVQWKTGGAHCYLCTVDPRPFQWIGPGDISLTRTTHSTQLHLHFLYLSHILKAMGFAPMTHFNPTQE